jgi:hypothetical protein
MYDFPFPSAENLRRLPAVTTVHTNKSIDVSKLGVAMLARLEMNIQAAGITPTSKSVAQGFAIFGSPSDDAMHYEKSSLIVTKASQNLVHTRCGR